ncbi:hypothetical protein D3C72_1750490 [compost metagenome]
MRTQMRGFCPASQSSLDLTISRASTFWAGGTLSSRSRISASALAATDFTIQSGLLPGTNIMDRIGFMALTLILVSW